MILTFDDNSVIVTGPIMMWGSAAGFSATGGATVTVTYIQSCTRRHRRWRRH